MSLFDPETLSALSPEMRRKHELETLLRVVTGIGRIRNVESVQWQLLGLLLEMIPADRAAIMLLDDANDISSVISWDKLSGPTTPVKVSPSLVRQVIQNHKGMLMRKAEGGKLPADIDSLGARSAICVPLIAADKVVGLIYVDSGDPAVRFDDQHLELMDAVGAIAGLALENARYMEWLENENRRLSTEIELEHKMVGESAALREVYRFIGRVAATDATVLITGESGTGKELVACAIHNNSRRAQKPFVAINCAALPETLLESELFGHEKGAFTGALHQKKGQFELAEAGTIFLDEIAELAPNLQAKLLRVLQERECMRIGGTRYIKLDVRVIAATNKDLESAVRAGGFRQDLFYRLNVVSVRTPALRERREDVPLLASYFVSKCAEKCNRKLRGISPEARAFLLQYDWPGNVRELENAIEHAVVLGSSAEFILPEDLPEAITGAAPTTEPTNLSYRDAVEKLRRKLIVQAVEQAKGNYMDAAKLLQLHPNYLYRLIRNMELRSALKKFAVPEQDVTP
jgi:transcriptional regulator with GAF, ATPase, and Fis domain